MLIDTITRRSGWRKGGNIILANHSASVNYINILKVDELLNNLRHIFISLVD